MGENIASQIVNGVITAAGDVSDVTLASADSVIDLASVIFTCSIAESYCQQAQKDLANKGKGVQDAVINLIDGTAWESVKDTATKAYYGEQQALENFAGILSGVLLPTTGATLAKGTTTFAIKVPDKVNANSKLPVVGKPAGYDKQEVRISTGAENIALYPKLKKDLAEQQKASFEKIIKDLSVKPDGSVLLIPDSRYLLAEARGTLSKDLAKQGNAAVARINIDSIDTKILAGHSQVDSPIGNFVGDGKTQFKSLELPNKKGNLIDRKTDSEYKILSNLADQLGDNTQAKGQVIIFTERPACESCLGVAEQFKKRYPNIDVRIFDNNGSVVKPNLGKK